MSRHREEYQLPLVDLEQAARLGDLLPGLEEGTGDAEREATYRWVMSERFAWIDKLQSRLPYAEEVVSLTQDTDLGYKQALVDAADQFWQLYEVNRQAILDQCERNPERMAEIEQEIPQIIRQSLERHIAIGHEPPAKVMRFLAGDLTWGTDDKPKNRLRDRVELVKLFLRDPQAALTQWLEPWTYVPSRLEQRMMAFMGAESVQWPDEELPIEYITAHLMRHLGRRLFASGDTEYVFGEDEFWHLSFFSVDGLRQQAFFSEEELAFVDEALDDEGCRQLAALAIEHYHLRAQFESPHSAVDHNALQEQTMEELLATYTPLLWWHAERLLMATDLAITTGHVPIGLEADVLEYQVVRRRLLEDPGDADAHYFAERLAMAASWYDRLIPVGAVTPLADRRHGDLLVTGFSLGMFGPSNGEVAEMVQEVLPDGMSLADIRRVAYRDQVEQEVAQITDERGQVVLEVTYRERGACAESNTIYIYDDVPPETTVMAGEYKARRTKDVGRTVRHEVGHAWHNTMAQRHADFYQLVESLLMHDVVCGKILFLTGLSTYPLEKLALLTPESVLKEVIAELWLHAEDEGFEQNLEAEGLWGELEILQCMRDEQRLRALFGKDAMLLRDGTK